MTLVDLGAPRRHRPGGAPVLRMGRAWAGRQGRGFLAAAIALLGLLLSSSAWVDASPPPKLRPVGPAVGQARYAVGDTVVLTVSSDGSGVSAYSLDSGAAVWRLEVAFVDQLWAAGGVVIVSVREIRRIGSDGREETRGADEVLAVDERTGRRLWVTPGIVPAGTPTDLVVVDGGEDLSAYEPATGTTLWRRPLAEHTTAPVAGGPPRLLVQQKTLLSIVDLQTGAITPLGRLSGVEAFLGLGDPIAVISVSRGAEAEPDFVVGGLAAQSDQLWSHALAAALVQRNSWACDGLLCTVQDGFTIAVDPASGVQVWRADAEWEHHRTMRVDGADLLVAVQPGRTGPRTLLLDPQTGQVRRDLANWSPLGEYAGRQLMQWIPASTSGDSWLGFLDPSARGGVRPLFPIGAAVRCSTTPCWLFCEVFGGGQAAALPLGVLDGLP